MPRFKRESAPKPAGYKYEFKQSEPQEGKGTPDLSISEKAMRDLPKSSYQLQANPYVEVNQASTAFPLMARLNKLISPNYEGHSNLEGGRASRYVSSLNTRLNKAIDSVLMHLDFKYRYLCMGTSTWNGTTETSTDTDGLEINGKMIDAISEAISQLSATTFTENAVLKDYVVETNWTMPEGYKVTGGGTTYTDSTSHSYTVYDDPAVVVFVMAIAYQICIQNAALTVSSYNKMRSFIKTALDHNYNKNINYINVFDGQIKKAAFQNLLQTVALDIQGEYFDVDWFKQINTLTTTPSAKSNSIWDPLAEVYGSNTLPFTFKIYLADKGTKTINGLVFSTDYLSQNIPTLADKTQTESMTLEEITARIQQLSSVYSILYMARQSTMSMVAASESAAMQVYNHLVSLYNGINSITTRVKARFTDLRTVFDVLKRTGVVNWSQDSYPTTFVKYDPIVPAQYRLIDDIIRSTLSGGKTIKYDTSTGNWVVQTPWDMYTGISEFDSVSGGCFITFCTKAIDNSSDNEVSRYIPKFFKFHSDSNVIALQSREGVEVMITRGEAQIGNTADLKRLAILPDQDSDYVFIPTFEATNDEVLNSFIVKTLLGFCGVADEAHTVSANNTNSVTHYYTLNPTVISMYDIQIVDVQNMMTAYGKTYGPIKGSAGDSPKIGFKI